MIPSKENTWRALQDEQPIVNSWWCYIGVHKWTKWDVPTKASSSIFFKQQCECVNCGIFKERKVGNPI
jgi:hypothetical protein